ncbi:MAG: hypothetical protein LZ173_10065 [Thaumarchaeota archaeon]|nr:hypothetical protein [Candidatus Geocrenenecus arthurdayi]
MSMVRFLFYYLMHVLDRYLNKPRIIVDKGPWYKWALEKLSLKNQYQRFVLGCC